MKHTSSTCLTLLLPQHIICNLLYILSYAKKLVYLILYCAYANTLLVPSMNMDTYRRYEKFAKIRIGVCHNNNNNSRLPMLRHLWRAVACGHRSLVFGDWLGFSGKADLKVRCHDIETRKQRRFFWSTGNRDG